jgi:fructokinase
MFRIGIDLGGSKIAGILLDADGSVLASRRIATPQGSYPDTLSAIVDLVAGIENDAGVSSGRATVGVGTPGALSLKTGLIKNANSTWLNGMPFDADLAAALGRPVRIANDANCLAVSEATDGAGAGAPIVFAAILGTGCGGGIAIAGRPVTGLNAIAGEWGHNPLPRATPDEYPGPLCYCGRHGCNETWLSGPGMAADHKAMTGQDLSAEDIEIVANAGDDHAQDTLARHRLRLAKALASVVNVLDPDVIVMGGGVSKMKGLYGPLPALLSEWAFSDGVTTPILPARHGDDSGVRGAAWLWPHEP